MALLWRTGHPEKTFKWGWDPLKVGPHTMIEEVGGMTDDHYTSPASKGFFFSNGNPSWYIAILSNRPGCSKHG